MKYSKPHLTFEQQINQLIERGLIVDFPAQAEHNLAIIGYYRLSAYWYQWRIRPLGHNEITDTPHDEFEGGHSFEEAVDLYSFDRRLRLMLMDAIERIEIALRVRIAYVVGKHGPLGYLDAVNLGPGCHGRRIKDGPTNYEWFINRNYELFDMSSEVFATHVKDKYDGIPPIWIATETWDFGILSTFFQIMSLADQLEVARGFSLPKPTMLTSWLLCLNYVRNVCAHHSRLFRRTLVNKPGKKDLRRIDALRHITEIPAQRQDKLYIALCVMLFLMRTVAPGSQWPAALKAFLRSFPRIEGSSLSDYGFPEGWLDEAIWI